MIEPGRSMVAQAGLTLYTVGYSKKTANKKYVFVDGGMSDNIRPALYGAKYRCDAANKMNEPRTEKVCVAGKCCESGDIIIEETMLPPLNPATLSQCIQQVLTVTAWQAIITDCRCPPVLLQRTARRGALLNVSRTRICGGWTITLR